MKRHAEKLLFEDDLDPESWAAALEHGKLHTDDAVPRSDRAYAFLAEEPKPRRKAGTGAAAGGKGGGSTSAKRSAAGKKGAAARRTGGVKAGKGQAAGALKTPPRRQAKK